MRSPALATLLLASFLTMPAALACDVYGSVNNHVTGDRYYFGLDRHESGALVPDGTLWQESNGVPGLQCEPETRPDGTVVPADTRLA